MPSEEGRTKAKKPDGKTTGTLNVEPSHRVTLLPGRLEFDARPDEDLLTAGLRRGIPLRYGCRHGNCGRCLHYLVRGDVSEGTTSPYALTQDALDQGAILLCSTYARTDVTVERPDVDIDDENDDEIIPPEPRLGEVIALSALSPSVIECRFRLNEPLHFHAGQYVEVWVPNTDQRRSLSIASPPTRPDELAFVLQLRPEGSLSSSVRTLRPGDVVRLQGPFGHFRFRGSGRPVVMVALGSGIAPLLSILRDPVEPSDSPSIALYYGGLADERPYVDELEELAKSTSHFSLHLAASPCNGSNEIGMLTQLLAGQFRDGSSYDAYIAGLPQMCDALCTLLEAKGTPERNIQVERFYPAEA